MKEYGIPIKKGMFCKTLGTQKDKENLIVTEENKM